MEHITPKEYGELVKKSSPNTKSYKTIPSAFIIGGLICVIGQLFMELYKHLGVTSDIIPTLASITLIALSSLFTGLNFYDNIAKVAGAGTLVPITGFSNAVSSAALEFKSEGFILGLGAKIFIIAGPVIAYGTIASVIYGLIVFMFNL